MTNGQIAQLQELAKCWIPKQGKQCRDRVFLAWLLEYPEKRKLSPGENLFLRRLWHQYRNQIAAMRKNRK